MERNFYNLTNLRTRKDNRLCHCKVHIYRGKRVRQSWNSNRWSFIKAHRIVIHKHQESKSELICLPIRDEVETQHTWVKDQTDKFKDW